MRALDQGWLDLDTDVVDTMETCVQCRACETACPSAVPFGEMMTETRRAIAAGPRRRRSRLMAIAMRVLAVGWLLRVASTVAAIGQRVGLVPSRRLGLPRRLPLRRHAIPSTGSDLWLFSGCVMDAWQRSVHADASAVLTAAGFGVTMSPSTGCCGALAEHGGLTDLAHRQAAAIMQTMPGDQPILVDSAGCGAMLKDYGRVIDTDEAQQFSARVFDVHEWLASNMDGLLAPRPEWSPPVVAVQDPCHLRHVQRVHHGVRAVLAGCATLVEVDDDGRCCGAGGAYSVTQPELADAIRATKVASIERATPDLVASANPGCSIHLGWAGIDARHPMSILADAIGVGSRHG